MAGFRKSRRIRIAKGVSLNISKSGISSSVKVGKVTLNSRRGATVNVAKGVSYNVGAGRSKRSKPSAAPKATRTAALKPPGPRYYRRPWGVPGWVYWTAGIFVALLFGAIPYVGPLLAILVVCVLMVFWLRSPKRLTDHTDVIAGTTSAASTYVQLAGDGNVAVVGEQHYQSALRWLASEVEHQSAVTAVLVPEPDNPHDLNAVRVDVLHEAAQYKVGYLSSEIAPDYQPILLQLSQQGACGTVSAKIWGVEQKAGALQVYLRLGSPESLVAPS